MIKNFKYYGRQYSISEDAEIIRLAYNDTRVQNYNGKIITLNRHNKAVTLKPYIDSDGYANITLISNNIRRTYRLHHIMYLVFIQNLDCLDDIDIPYNSSTNYLQINHKDGNKLNNKYTNLELVSLQDNVSHAVTTKLHNSQTKAKYVEIYRYSVYIDTIWKTRCVSEYIETNFNVHINSADISIMARNGNIHYSGFSFKYKV